MDETPIKAGRTDHGTMKQRYFWPVYGDQDEVCLPFHSSRRAQHVREVLGLDHTPGSVLLSDGYAASRRYIIKIAARVDAAQLPLTVRRTFNSLSAPESMEPF